MTSAAKANRNAAIVDRLEAEIERLRAALRNVRGYIKDCDHEPAVDEIDAALGDVEQKSTGEK